MTLEHSEKILFRFLLIQSFPLLQMQILLHICTTHSVFLIITAQISIENGGEVGNSSFLQFTNVHLNV